MSDRVTIPVDVDTSQAEAQLEEFKDKMDEAVGKMKEDRDNVIRGIREGFRMLASLVISYRQVMSIMGQNIDPFFDALLSVIAATVSLLLAVATGLLATGVGGAAAAVVAGIAIGLNIITTANLIASKIEIMASLADLNARMPTPVRGVAMGVGF